MAVQEWYKDWFNSPFYHKLYFDRDEKEAEIFIKKLVDHLEPKPGSRLLDIACGKGRHSKIMASFRYQVTGIDISPNSIEIAKQYEGPNLDFYLHDMRLPFWANYFHYAFNFFTSFGYFKTRREHDDAIRTIANGLRSNGVFVIDYLNVHYSEDRLVRNDEKMINGTTYEIHRWHDETHFHKKIIIHDPLLLHPVVFTEKVSKFSFGDFNDMLSYHGLQVQEIFGDYQLGNYDVRTKPRLIVVAKKSSR